METGHPKSSNEEIEVWEGRAPTAADGWRQLPALWTLAAFGARQVQPLPVKERGEQRGEVVCPKSHSQNEEEPAWNTIS